MSDLGRAGRRLRACGWGCLLLWACACQSQGGDAEKDASIFVEGLGDPAGIAVSKTGRVYVADAKKGLVHVFDAEGRRLRSLGKSTLTKPLGVAVGGEGRIWVSDSIGDKIYEFDPQGTLRRAFGRSGEGRGEFSGAGPLSLGPGQRLYLVDIDHNRIQVFDTAGRLLTIFGKEGHFRTSAPGEFYWPGGIAVDGQGRVYVADTHNFRIQRFTPKGAFELQFGTQGEGLGGFDHVFGLAVDDEKGLLYCADDRVKLAAGGRRIDVFTLEGQAMGYLVPQEGGSPLIHPFDVALASDGWLLVTERGQGRVRRLDPARLHKPARQPAPASRKGKRP